MKMKYKGRQWLTDSLRAGTRNVRGGRVMTNDLDMVARVSLRTDLGPTKVRARLLDMDVTITPDGVQFLQEQTRKAQDRYGNIIDYSVPATLIAAGITAAHTRGAGNVRVTAKHISRGWVKELSVCPGNSLPHQCAGLSIVGRRDKIRNLRGMTGVLLRECLKMPGE